MYKIKSIINDIFISIGIIILMIPISAIIGLFINLYTNEPNDLRVHYICITASNCFFIFNDVHDNFLVECFLDGLCFIILLIFCMIIIAPIVIIIYEWFDSYKILRQKN